MENLFKSIGVCLPVVLSMGAASEEQVNVQSIHHEVKLLDSQYLISSDFKVQIEKRAHGKLSELFLESNRSYKDIDLLAIEYNGDEFNRVAGTRLDNKTVFRFENSEPLDLSFNLKVTYKLKREIDSLELLRPYDLLQISSMVADKSQPQKIKVNHSNVTFLNFSKRISQSATLIHPVEYGVVGSNRSVRFRLGSRIPPTTVGQFTFGFYKMKKWSEVDIKIAETPFTIMARRNGSGISTENLVKATQLIWPQYSARFFHRRDHVYLIGAEAPIGGGPLGGNMLGVYDSEEIDPDFQEFIKHTLRIRKYSRTNDYVRDIYKGSSKPWWDYTLDMVSHELGHLYFGFGETFEDVEKAYQGWFSLGLGLVYDRSFYQAVQHEKSPFFRLVEDSWLDHFAKIPSIDQRLDNPNTDNDELHDLSRLQVFAHGKALYVLRNLREEVGHEKFDKVVQLYLRNKQGQFGYKAFRELLLPIFKELDSFENEFLIR